MRTGFLFKLLELASVSLVFGASVVGAPAQKLRLWGVAAALALAGIAVARGALYLWTPIHAVLIAVSLLMAFCAWRKNQLALIALSGAYLVWMAQRGY